MALNCNCEDLNGNSVPINFGTTHCCDQNGNYYTIGADAGYENILCSDCTDCCGKAGMGGALVGGGGRQPAVRETAQITPEPTGVTPAPTFSTPRKSPMGRGLRGRSDRGYRNASGQMGLGASIGVMGAVLIVGMLVLLNRYVSTAK